MLMLDFRWKYPPNLNDMTAVLKLSDRWICAEPKEYAIGEINRLNFTPTYGSVDPCQLLEFSRHYPVDEWFRPSFDQLVYTQIHTLTLEGIRSIGERNYTALSWCQSTIHHLRLSISATPPPIEHHSPSCKSSRSCEKAWRFFWWNDFAKDYLLKPLSELQAREYLDNAAPRDVNPDCKDTVVRGYNEEGSFRCGTQGSFEHY